MRILMSDNMAEAEEARTGNSCRRRGNHKSRNQLTMPACVCVPVCVNM